jgi:hypothetical protein
MADIETVLIFMAKWFGVGLAVCGLIALAAGVKLASARGNDWPRKALIAVLVFVVVGFILWLLNPVFAYSAAWPLVVLR